MNQTNEETTEQRDLDKLNNPTAKEMVVSMKNGTRGQRDDIIKGKFSEEAALSFNKDYDSLGD